MSSRMLKKPSALILGSKFHAGAGLTTSGARHTLFFRLMRLRWWLFRLACWGRADWYLAWLTVTPPKCVCFSPAAEFFMKMIWAWIVIYFIYYRYGAIHIAAWQYRRPLMHARSLAMLYRLCNGRKRDIEKVRCRAWWFHDTPPRLYGACLHGEPWYRMRRTYSWMRARRYRALLLHYQPARPCPGHKILGVRRECYFSRH